MQESNLLGAHHHRLRLSGPTSYRSSNSPRKAGESNTKPEGSLCFRGSARPSRVHLPGEESVGIEPKALGLAQVSGLAMAQPWSLSVAGSQGLEPCRAGFGDRLAPCALPTEMNEWSHRESNPGFQTAGLASSRWTMTPWNRRESNSHRHGAGVVSSRWTTAPCRTIGLVDET